MAIDVYEELPPSPTLTNPDMILPSRLSMIAASPTRTSTANSSSHHYQYTQQPLQSQYAQISQQYQQSRLNQVPLLYSQNQSPQRRFPQRPQDPNDPRTAFSNFSSYGAPISPAKTSPGVVVRPSSPLESINESSDTTPKRRVNGTAGTTAASTASRDHGGPHWPFSGDGRPSSGMSIASGSELSDDLEQWAARKAALAADRDGEESVAETEDDREGSSPLVNRVGPEDDFLSRRAEIILANAKSRLKMMEGNLKGARYSLSSNSLSNRYSVASSKAGGSKASGVHSRATSEVSMPMAVPPMPSIHAQSSLPKRSSSALGTFGPNLKVIDRSGSLRGARSQEAMRENRLKHWIMDERDRSASTSVDMPRAAPAIETQPLPTLRGSPTPSEIRRPVSQASSIRAQMNELKGRIYEIKERAKENEKRSSSIGQRTPSPQASSVPTSTHSDSPKTISHTTGPGPTIEDEEYDDDDDDWLGASEVDHAEVAGSGDTTEYEESHYEDAEETLDDLQGTLERQKRNRSNTYQHGDSLILDGVIEEEEHDEFSESGGTEYYEADQVLAGPHEDRFDAFDYSNMFLHSAMSSAYARRDSYSSESSVETTRPASPLRSVQAQELSTQYDEDDLGSSPPHKIPPLPRRTTSSTSISSIATFETAAEGEEEDDDHATSGDLLEGHRVPHLLIPDPDSQIQPSSPAHMSPTLSNPRASVIIGSPPSFLPSPPAGTTMNANRRSSSYLRPSSGLLSSFIGLDSVKASPETIQKDRALVESLVGALQRCCLELQRAPEDKRTVMRERLLETKRVLVEVLEGFGSGSRPVSSGKSL